MKHFHCCSEVINDNVFCSYPALSTDVHFCSCAMQTWSTCSTEIIVQKYVFIDKYLPKPYSPYWSRLTPSSKKQSNNTFATVIETLMCSEPPQANLFCSGYLELEFSLICYCLILNIGNWFASYILIFYQYNILIFIWRHLFLLNIRTYLILWKWLVWLFFLVLYTFAVYLKDYTATVHSLAEYILFYAMLNMWQQQLFSVKIYYVDAKICR